MKKYLYSKIFLITLIIFFGYYCYMLIYNSINANFDVNNKTNILFYEQIQIISSDINTLSSKKFKVCLEGNSNRINMYMRENNIIEIGNIPYYYYTPQMLSQIIKLDEKLKQENIDFLYMDVPIKQSYYLSDIYKYNYSVNEQAYDMFFRALDSNNIDYFDVTNVLNNSRINVDDMYYKYDHHWRLETGFYFTKQLVSYLNYEYKYNLDVQMLNEANFEEETYIKSDKGYYTKLMKLNEKYYDDFTYLLPKFQTSYSVYNDKWNNGKLEDVVYRINEKYDYNEMTRYLLIPGGTEKLVKVVNNRAKNNKKILIIGNSFTKAITPFLSLTAKEIDIVDVRKNVGNYSGNIVDYARNNNFDLVIFFTGLNNEDRANLNI